MTAICIRKLVLYHYTHYLFLFAFDTISLVLS